MATIKSFTGIPQSKKLAEFLPFESADMCYLSEESLFPKVNYNSMVFFNSNEEIPTTIIPCWSLAALLGVLPNGKDISTTLSRGGWKIEPLEYVDKWWCEYEDDTHTKDFSASADNPVDACYELVLKLHKLNLL